jgi:hypothetical protein
METSEAMSETIRAFARPLLYLDPAGPADIETLRTSMMLAMICWNLPVYENTNARLYAHTKKALDAALHLVPAAVRACLHRLVDDRTTKFGEVPCAILVEIHGSSLDDARIVAEAMTPKAKSSMPKAKSSVPKAKSAS